MSHRFDVALVFVPRTHGDELFRVGQRSQSIEDVRPTLTAVEEALDALDRAFHPTLDSKVHGEQTVTARTGQAQRKHVAARFA